jgi:transposase
VVRIGPLSDEQRQALEQVRRRAVGRVSQRAHLVLLSSRGYTVEQIAEIFGVGEDVVRKWLHRYEQRGPRGLDDRPRPGRPPKHRLARHIVDAQASNPPCNNGLVHGNWTVGLLAAFLATRFRLVLSPGSVRRYLRQAGWRWARPRLALATHAPRGQRKEDPATHLKLALIAQAVASTATLLYLDACDLHLLPVIRACWMKGPRLRVPTPGQNAKRALFGALNARTGRLHHLVRPRKRAAQFVESWRRWRRPTPPATSSSCLTTSSPTTPSSCAPGWPGPSTPVSGSFGYRNTPLTSTTRSSAFGA